MTHCTARVHFQAMLQIVISELIGDQFYQARKGQMAFGDLFLTQNLPALEAKNNRVGELDLVTN